jgi:hypothetical protein
VVARILVPLLGLPRLYSTILTINLFIFPEIYFIIYFNT